MKQAIRFLVRFVSASVLVSHLLAYTYTPRCLGVYDKSIFASLDRICEDCYNLIRERELTFQCRNNCFTSPFFKGCIDVLLLNDQEEQIKTWIKQLHGADPKLGPLNPPESKENTTQPEETTTQPEETVTEPEVTTTTEPEMCPVCEEYCDD